MTTPESPTPASRTGDKKSSCLSRPICRVAAQADGHTAEPRDLCRGSAPAGMWVGPTGRDCRGSTTLQGVNLPDRQHHVSHPGAMNASRPSLHRQGLRWLRAKLPADLPASATSLPAASAPRWPRVSFLPRVWGSACGCELGIRWGGGWGSVTAS